MISGRGRSDSAERRWGHCRLPGLLLRILRRNGICDECCPRIIGASKPQPPNLGLGLGLAAARRRRGRGRLDERPAEPTVRAANECLSPGAGRRVDAQTKPSR